MEYKLTFIIDNAKNSEDIVKTLKSIANNDEKYLKLIKIIIVNSDRIGSNLLEEINEYKEKYNLDITIRYDKDNFFKIINKLLDSIYTEFITFIQSGYIYTPNYIQALIESFNEKTSEVNIIHIKNTKKEIKSQIVDLNMFYNKIPLEFWGLIFKTKSIQNNKFHEKNNYIAEKDTFFKILLQNNKYLLIEGSIDDEKLKLESNIDNNYYLKSYWYIEYFRYIKEDLIPYIEKSIGLMPRYMQYVIFNEVKTRFVNNLNNKNKHIVDDDLDEFLDLCSYILNYISDDIILNQDLLKNNKISKELKLILIKLKYGDDFKPFYIRKNKSLLMCTKENFLLDITKERIRIDAMEYENDMLIIDFSLFGFVDFNRFNIICMYDDKEINVEETFRYAHTKYFGRVFTKRNTFRIQLNKNQLRDNSQLKFFIESENKQYLMTIEAIRYTARITSHLSKSYWKFDNYIVSMPTKNIIKIERKKLWKCIEKEFFMLLTCLKQSPKTFLLRLLYHINYPKFKNKNIWLTYDKLYKGGDNGEYFYKYIIKQNDGVDGHYVINEKYPDAKRLKNEGYKPLLYGTIRHKLYFLYASIVATTHGGVYNFNGFDNKEIKYFQDLLKFSVVCIQHGLTVQDLAFNSNRLFNNMKRYYCASKYEIENLSKPIYGYEDKTILKLTGVPRYDGLKNNDQKQILITPTWRNYIALPVTKKEETKPYYPGFKDTDYFKIYNELISDKKFIETAKRTGYKIIYLLHPVVSSQIDDYEKNENVSIIPATEVNYEKILTESSLMVTDYSGVQFDFAYMRKPVVYYHHPKLPPHYKESGFSYENIGFGEICNNNDYLVDLLCAYMENNCEMSPFYRERANDFFKFSDFNNCKRIYDDLIDYQIKKGEI